MARGGVDNDAREANCFEELNCWKKVLVKEDLVALVEARTILTDTGASTDNQRRVTCVFAL